jgi:hypothetical protein
MPRGIETECIESLTDEDILLIVKNPEISEVTEESYNIPPKQITFEEVRESIKTILTFFNNRKREEEEVKQVKKFKSFNRKCYYVKQCANEIIV